MSPERFVKGESERTLKNLASIFSSRVAAAYLFGFFGHLLSAHQTMVLESYFDDSSDSRRSNLYACGGLLGGPDQWDRFDILWNNETHALKEPFRSADCEGGYGQFRDWPKSERDALMARLVSVICKIRLSGFASIVPVVEYKKVFPHCKEHDPFLLSLRQVVMNMAAIADILKNQVTLWFERGSVNAAIAAIFESIAEFKSWPPAR